MIKLKTDALKDLVTKANKGVAIDPLIPITNYMCVKSVNEKLSIITTDSTNYLYVEETVSGLEDFYFVINTDVFIKLISKITSEYTTFSIDENVLLVEGNGVYKIALPLDESGNPLRFKDPMNDIDVSDAVELNVDELRFIVKSLKPSLYKNNNIPCLTKYYFGDCVLTSDQDQVGCYNKAILPNPALLSTYILNILDIITSSNITYAESDDYVVMKADDVAVCGVKDNDVDIYPKDRICEILNLEANSSCMVNKNTLINVLDRISLFIGTYDKNTVTLDFMEDGINISSISTSGSEFIEYNALFNFKPFVCNIDVSMLLRQLKAYADDLVSIGFGDDSVLKLTYKDLTQLIALSTQ